MSLTHEQIREDAKERINELNENQDISQIEDEIEHIQYQLLNSRQPLSDELRSRLRGRLHTLQNTIDSVNDNSEHINDIKRNLENTMSTARVASLPSFQTKNSQNVNKALSDPYLLKHITSYNTGYGGRRNSRRNNRKTKKNNKNSKRQKRSRSNKKSRSRRYRK